MDRTEVASTLQSQIRMSSEPIGMAFVDGQPEGVSRIRTNMPSACSFWREAEKGVFYAAAEDHFHCPLGSMVMGFDLPDEQVTGLMQDVMMMCESAYVRPEEVANVPKVERKSAGIVYGPLAQMPMPPDAALLLVNPEQAMEVSEAAELINWAAAPAGVYGRPGCAAIPVALSGGGVTQSFGCVGMRINAEIPANLMLMVIPGDRLEPLVESLEKVVAIHNGMTTHYAIRLANLHD